jgi:DNA polymerase
MPVPREILEDLRNFVEVEIQAGRRMSPVDAEAAAAFLAAKPEGGAAGAQGGSHGVLAPPVAATTHRPSPPAVPAGTMAAGTAAAAEPAPAGVAARAAAAADLAAIAASVAECRECNLALTRTKAVPGEGRAILPDVMFVGEAPGRDEDLQGRPFIGRAGQLLDKMIAAMGYRREDVFIANIIKCRPPQNRTPTPDEMAVCIPYLRRQIAIVRPRTIVALGATAFKGLTGDPLANISRHRGVWSEFEGIPMMPTFHPAYLLRVPSAKRAVWEDLQKVMARLKG